MLVWIGRIAVFLIVGLPVVVFLKEAVFGLAAPIGASVLPIATWGLLARSLGLAAAAALVSAAVGVPAGLVAARLTKPLRGAFIFVFLMPLALPGAVHAYIWRNAALQAGFLGPLFVEGGSETFNFCGALWSLVSAFWTIPALAVFAVAAGAGRRFEMEAAVFAPAALSARKILLPMMRPAAIASAGLVFILAFSEYGAAALWRIRTFSEHILSLYSSLAQLGRAAAAGLVPAAAMAALAALLYPVARRAFSTLNVERAVARPEVLWRPGRLLKATLFLAVVVLVVVPVVLAGREVLGEAADWRVLRPVFLDLASTVVVSAAAAFVAAAAAGVVAAHWMAGGTVPKGLVALSVAAFVLPAAGFGLAVVTIGRWPFVPAGFSSSAAIVVYALTGRFLLLPLVFASVMLASLERRYGNLVRISGAGTWKGVWRVGLPLAAPVLLAAWGTAVVLGVGELSMTSLVAPPGRQPVSVHLFNLMHYAHQGEAFAVGLVMMFAGSSMVLITGWVAGRLWKRYLYAT